MKNINIELYFNTHRSLSMFKVYSLASIGHGWSFPSSICIDTGATSDHYSKSSMTDVDDPYSVSIISRHPASRVIE
jgi:hypothetical protein